MYEYPPPKYSAERLFEILFDPDIPYHKVCKEKPSGVRCSAVDTGYLKCIDDIKKDEFGIWNYSGSHPVAYSVHSDNGHMVIEKCKTGAVGKRIYHLRRIHCTHPSNPGVKRMICFLSGNPT